jgi:hypothetical protein
MIRYWLAANPFGINANDIGIPTSTPSIDRGISNVVGILAVLVGMVSVIGIIYGALLITGSAGDPARIKQGRNAILYACVGIIVSISAYAIVTFIVSEIK